MPIDQLLILIGPSATGKSTVARALARRGLVTVLPTWTTRPRRPDEPADTIEHRFVDELTFDRLSASRTFLLEGSHPGLAHRYGLRRPGLVHGVPTVIARANHVPMIAAAVGVAPVVYQIGAPVDDVAARLAERGTDPAEREQRLAGFHAERVAGARICDRAFLNHGSVTDLVTAVSQALAADFESLSLCATGGIHA